MSQNTDSQTSGGDVDPNLSHYPWLDGFQRQLRELSLNLENLDSKDYYRLVKKFESLVSVEATKLRHKPKRSTKFVPIIKRLIGNLKLLAVSMECDQRREERVSAWFGLILTHYINIILASSMKNSRSTEAIASDLYVFGKQILEGCEDYLLDTFLTSNVIQDTADRNTIGYFVLWKIIQERRIYTSENEPFLKFLTILKLFQECEGAEEIVSSTILKIKGFPPGFRQFVQQKLKMKNTSSDNLDLVSVVKKIKTLKIIKLSKERLTYYTSRDRAEDDGSDSDDTTVMSEQKLEEFFIDTKGQGQSWLSNYEDDLKPIEDMDILMSEAEDETNESVDEKYVPPSQALFDHHQSHSGVNGDLDNHGQVEVKTEQNEDEGDLDLLIYSEYDDEENSEEVMKFDIENMDADFEGEETPETEKEEMIEEMKILTDKVLDYSDPDTNIKDEMNQVMMIITNKALEDSDSFSGDEEYEFSDDQSSHSDEKLKSPSSKSKAVRRILVDEESDSDIEIEAIYSLPSASDPSDSGSDERDEAGLDSEADHFCSPGSTQSDSESDEDFVKNDQVENRTVLDKEISAEIEMPLLKEKFSENDKEMDEIEMISTAVKSIEIKMSLSNSQTVENENQEEEGKRIEKELALTAGNSAERELSQIRTLDSSIEMELTPIPEIKLSPEENGKCKAKFEKKEESGSVSVPPLSLRSRAQGPTRTKEKVAKDLPSAAGGRRRLRSSVIEPSVFVQRSASSSKSGDSPSQQTDLKNSQCQNSTSSLKSRTRATRVGKRAATVSVPTIKEDEASSPKRGVATRASRSKATVIATTTEVPITRGRGRAKAPPDAATTTEPPVTRGRGREKVTPDADTIPVPTTATRGRGRGARGRGGASTPADFPKRTLRDRKVPPKK